MTRIHGVAAKCSGDIRDASQAEQIERGVTARGEVGGRVVGTHLAGVLAQRHIAHVMQAVLNRPASAPNVCDLCGICLLWGHTCHGVGPRCAGLADPRATDILDFTIDTADLGERGLARN